MIEPMALWAVMMNPPMIHDRIPIWGVIYWTYDSVMPDDTADRAI